MENHSYLYQNQDQKIHIPIKSTHLIKAEIYRVSNIII